MTFAEAEVALAAALPGYETRPQQQRLAQAVEGLFANHAEHDPVRDNPTNLFGQAGCGVGKSLAYLISAILSGRRTIVSVTTKALQEQIADKDMPFLEAHLGVPFTWCVLKGRSNYFCERVAMAADEVPHLSQVLRYADEHPDWEGTREGLPFEVSPMEWAQLSSDAETCRDLKCRDAHARGERGCYAEAARARARTRQIVVVNHALFCTDLELKARGIPGMLQEYEFVIFDEAHELESVAGDSLGGRLVEGTFRSLAHEVRNWVRNYGDEEAAEVFDPLTQDLLTAAAALFGPSGLPPGRVRTAVLNENDHVLAPLITTAAELRAVWEKLSLENIPSVDYKQARNRRAKVTTRINNALDRLADLIEENPEMVRWVEMETGRRNEQRKAIRTCPVSVAPFLRRHLFDRTPCALVSATLMVEGKPDYLAGRLGVDRHVSLDVGTPFDFERQARLYVPEIAEPRGRDTERWEEAVDEQLVELVRASRGRALVLFTSLRHMRACLGRIRGQIEQPVLVQGEEPVAVLSRRFREETSSVLFGSKSFMTGFDVQGESLSLLVVTKMPFPVPDEPLTEARCDQIRAAGGNDFSDFTIPTMSLVLQQAIGRLIRHRNDRGVAVILDPRMVSKGYGKRILRDLPPMRRVRDLTDVEAFFALAPEPVPA